MADDLFAPMSVSAAGLSAQRKRMEAIAKNIANAEATRTEDGSAYRRRTVVIDSKESSRVENGGRTSHRVSLARTSPLHMGSRVRHHGQSTTLPVPEATEVVDQAAGHRLVHDPYHPDADENGYVQMSDINGVSEMVDMMAATRAYEANLAAMRAYRSMVTKSLEI